VLHVTRCKYRTQKLRKKSPSAHHRTTLSGYIFATKAHIDNQKKTVKQQYLLHMSSQYGELWHTNGSEIGSGDWSTPAIFNGFRILASLLQRHRSLEANQALHDVGRLLGWYIIYIFGGSCPMREFCPVQNSLYVQVLRSPIVAALYCTALQQRASAKLCGVVQGMELPNFRRGRHLYSAGRPSRWASAHILVLL